MDESEVEKLARHILMSHYMETAYEKEVVLKKIASALLSHGKSCYERGAEKVAEYHNAYEGKKHRIYELEAKLKEAVSKGENLCTAHGLLLIEKHDLEQRLSQAEAELEKYAMVCQHPCGHWVSSVMSFCTVCRDENTKKEYRERLSHLMDVAGKIAGALKVFSDMAEYLDKRWFRGAEGLKSNRVFTLEEKEKAWGRETLSIESLIEAKLACAEWDGIK
jgi:hypothetical protein